MQCQIAFYEFEIAGPLFSMAEEAVSIGEDVGNFMICVNFTGPAGGLDILQTATVVAIEGTANSM